MSIMQNLKNKETKESKINHHPKDSQHGVENCLKQQEVVSHFFQFLVMERFPKHFLVLD